jgi:hypothetical protein
VFSSIELNNIQWNLAIQIIPFLNLQIMSSHSPVPPGVYLDLEEVKQMILDNLYRTKDSGADLKKEWVGVKINGADLTTLATEYGAKDYVAIFALDDSSQTSIIMGLDVDGKLVKNGDDKYVAIERWAKFGPTLDKVENDPGEELNKIFP